MNKKQKILTIVALAVFGAIIFFHYYSFDRWPTPYLTGIPAIDDVRLLIFALTVFYAGLFFILATPRAK
jgi:hypothetical protein